MLSTVGWREQNSSFRETQLSCCQNSRDSWIWRLFSKSVLVLQTCCAGRKTDRDRPEWGISDANMLWQRPWPGDHTQSKPCRHHGALNCPQQQCKTYNCCISSAAESQVLLDVLASTCMQLSQVIMEAIDPVHPFAFHISVFTAPSDVHTSVYRAL